MKKYLNNDEMTRAFGDFNFITNDMLGVCKAQRQLTLKEVKKWLKSLPIDFTQKSAVDFDIGDKFAIKRRY